MTYRDDLDTEIINFYVKRGRISFFPSLLIRFISISYYNWIIIIIINYNLFFKTNETLNLPTYSQSYDFHLFILNEVTNFPGSDHIQQ